MGKGHDLCHPWAWLVVLEIKRIITAEDESGLWDAREYFWGVDEYISFPGWSGANRRTVAGRGPRQENKARSGSGTFALVIQTRYCTPHQVPLFSQMERCVVYRPQQTRNLQSLVIQLPRQGDIQPF